MFVKRLFFLLASLSPYLISSTKQSPDHSLILDEGPENSGEWAISGWLSEMELEPRLFWFKNLLTQTYRLSQEKLWMVKHSLGTTESWNFASLSLPWPDPMSTHHSLLSTGSEVPLTQRLRAHSAFCLQSLTGLGSVHSHLGQSWAVVGPAAIVLMELWVLMATGQSSGWSTALSPWIQQRDNASSVTWIRLQQGL